MTLLTFKRCSKRTEHGLTRDGQDLPIGWRCEPLAKCVDVLDSRRKPVNATERASRAGPVPYFGATGQVGWIDDYLFDEEIVLLGEDGAPFYDKSKPIAYVVDGKSWVNNHAHVLRARREFTSNRYVKYFLDSFDFNGYVQGTTRDKLTQGAMGSIPVLLPPLELQHHLVNVIEEVDGKRTSARSHLAVANRAITRFRQAVLASACSGRLTSDWRSDFPLPASSSERDDVPKTWALTSLGEIAASIRGGSNMVPCDEPSAYPILRSSSVRAFNVDYDDVRYLSEDQSQRAENFLQMGDLLITRLSGSIEYVGNCALVQNPARRPIQYPDRLFCCRLSDPTEARYVEICFAGPSVRRQIESASRSAAGHQRISISDLKAFAIARPPLAEQHEIVRRVEQLLALAERIERRIEAASERVDRSAQAVLAKAFRGDLMSTDAASANVARELL
jgi:type I restriction enzyme, S subunit